MITEKLREINQEIDEFAEEGKHTKPKLLLISKHISQESILEAYKGGCRFFGENKVQELLQKQQQLPEDIEWHFVGHLQTNKAKKLVGNVALIHSVDSEKLARAIDHEAEKREMIQDCLLQVNISREETKFGFDMGELKEIFQELKVLPHLRIRGLMGIASFPSDDTRIKEEFSTLHWLFRELKKNYQLYEFQEISMGMSEDWKAAMEKGSTILRIGTAVFGERAFK